MIRVILFISIFVFPCWADKRFIPRKNYYQAAFNAFKQKKIDQAETLLKPAMEQRPLHRKTWELMAIIKAQKEQYIEAIKHTYKLISYFHGEELLRKKSIPEVADFLENVPPEKYPQKVILQYYFNMASYHTLKIRQRFNAMREKDSLVLFKRHPQNEEYLIEQHFRMAEKHFFICDYFGFKHPQFENAKVFLARLEKQIRNRQEAPMLSTGGKEKTSSEFKYKGDELNRKFYIDFFAEMFLWQEKLKIVHNQGQTRKLLATNVGPCTGAQISYRIEHYDVNTSSCFFIGTAGIQNVQGSDLRYANGQTRVRGAITGTSGFYRVGERFGFGIFTGHIYRHGFYKNPMRNLVIEEREVHRFMVMAETRFEWKNLFLTQKFGYVQEFSGAIWSFGVHYRL